MWPHIAMLELPVVDFVKILCLIAVVYVIIAYSVVC